MFVGGPRVGPDFSSTGRAPHQLETQPPLRLLFTTLSTTHYRHFPLAHRIRATLGPNESCRLLGPRFFFFMFFLFFQRINVLFLCIGSNPPITMRQNQDSTPALHLPTYTSAATLSRKRTTSGPDIHVSLRCVHRASRATTRIVENCNRHTSDVT